MNTSHRRLLALATITLTFGCPSDGGPPPSSPTARPEAASTSPAEAAPVEAHEAPEGALRRAVGVTFGLPLPEGLELIERDEEVVRFVTEHSLERLVDFYRRELEGYRFVARADGTKFEPEGGTGADVYVVAGEDTREVFYFRQAIELPELATPSLGTGSEARDTRELPFAERYPWPQGPVAPPNVEEALESAAAPEIQGGGTFYEERFEEIDGERVRVLTLRDTPADDLLEPDTSPSSPFPESWHRLPQAPGGSYDRGDGERSLRATPTLGDDGQPLPFYGTQRVETDPNEHMH